MAKAVKKPLKDNEDKKKVAILLPSLVDCKNCKMLEKNETIESIGYCLKIRMPIPLDRKHHCIFKK